MDGALHVPISAPASELWLLQQMEKKTFLLHSREGNGSDQHPPLTAPLSILLSPIIPTPHTHAALGTPGRASISSAHKCHLERKTSRVCASWIYLWVAFISFPIYSWCALVKRALTAEWAACLPSARLTPSKQGCEMALPPQNNPWGSRQTPGTGTRLGPARGQLLQGSYSGF